MLIRILSKCIWALAALIMVSGCGGGGGGSRPPAAVPTAVSVGTARISGVVYTGITVHYSGGADVLKTPLAGADVKCGDTSGKTDGQGRFTILNARSGKVSCNISGPGYALESIEAEIPPGGAFNATETVLVPTRAGAVKISSTDAAAPVSFDGAESPLLKTGVSLSGVAAGAHTVAVAAEGYETAASQTVSVKAGATATVSLELVKKMVSIDIVWAGKPVQVGKTLKMAANCGYFDGTAGDCTGKVSWDCSNTGAGKITEDGTFTAMAPGETRVSATRLQSRITHPGVIVKVVCPDGTSWTGGACSGDTLVSIKVLPAEVRLEKGGAAVLNAVCVWRVAGEAPCPELVWTSSTAGVATVDSAGSVSGKMAGEAIITARSENSASNPITIQVVETQYPDITCSGVSGFCLDVAGVAEGPDSRLGIKVAISNPPAAGLGTGVITLTWKPGALVYESNSPASAIVGIGDSKQDGKFVFVFTSPMPIVSPVELFTVAFSAPQGPAVPVEVKIDRTLAGTNFTDFGLNLISQSGIVFKDGYAGR